MSIVDLLNRTDEPEVAALLRLFPGDLPERSIPIGWRDGTELVACAVVKRHSPEAVELISVMVGANKRRRGFGRSIVDAVCDVATAQRIVSARHPFLERCGFLPAGERCLVREIVEAPADEPGPWTLSDLDQAIRFAWSRETSSVPDEWTDDNPSLGLRRHVDRRA